MVLLIYLVSNLEIFVRVYMYSVIP